MRECHALLVWGMAPNIAGLLFVCVDRPIAGKSICLGSGNACIAACAHEPLKLAAVK